MEGRGGMGRGIAGRSPLPAVQGDLGGTSASGTKRSTLQALPRRRSKARYALDQLERYLNPDRLCKVNAAALSTFQTKLRDTGIKDTTIAAVLRPVKAALSWGVSVGMLAKVPKINMPKGSKGRKMKGGALVGEQFDRMLAAVPKVRPKDSADGSATLPACGCRACGWRNRLPCRGMPTPPLPLTCPAASPRFRIKGEAQKSAKMS